MEAVLVHLLLTLNSYFDKWNSENEICLTSKSKDTGSIICLNLIIQTIQKHN